MELDTAGYDVVECADGEQALAAAVEHLPDVILLDIEMPVMDGYEAVVALKADERTADIPVVFLTGRSGAQDVVRALRLGGHDYVRKPPEPTELLARVRAALRVKALQDELRTRAAELETVSRTDFLTGLYNRRHTEEHLRMLESGAVRHGYPLSVLLVDVDNFKSVNDTLGHQVGDRVLVGIGQRLQAALRLEDVVGRWGGEEFLMVLPHTSLDQATALAERLRELVCHTPIETGVADDAPLTVTVSIGGAAAEDTGAHELVHLADQGLYEAKQAGRNCVRLHLSPG